MRILYTVILLSFVLFPCISKAEDGSQHCKGTDQHCLFGLLETTTATINEDAWRDATYREIAKLLSTKNQTELAIAQIAKIQKPDTKAMTIRGIGMEAAKNKLPEKDYDKLFTRLRAEAETIDHPPSYAIALTYIAMAQAFAGDDDGAMTTAKSMENDALRNKALGESAEIQAERGDLKAVMASIGEINDNAFRNKAFRIVAKIFADRAFYDESLATALKIENNYQRAQAILYNLTKQIVPEEVSIQ